MTSPLKPAWHTHLGILLILSLFLIIGLGYSISTPLFEAPAEGSHFRYVRHIAEGRGLPLIPPDIQFPQEHQAPLYYLLTGLLVSPLDLTQPSPPQPNPYHVFNNPGPVEDNRNSYYHSPDEAFPYRGMTLAVHIGRLVALAMGGLTVLATYAIANELLEGWQPLSTSSTSASAHVYPMQRSIALGAAALTAFNPQFVFISSVMSNDTTAAAFSGWSLFFALRTLRRGISWRRSLLLGAAVGLAAISKLNGLAMLGIAMLALAMAGLPLPPALRARFEKRSGRPDRSHAEPSSSRSMGLWLAHTLLVGALVALIAAWWYVRNWILYRDPFTLKLAAERWGTGGVTRSFHQIVGYWREIEVGFWGLFGHDNLLMDDFIYDILHVIELLALAGLIAWGLRVWYDSRRNKQPSRRFTFWSGLAIVALTIFAGLVGLYRWLQLTDLPAGRYLYPAVSAINVLLFLGLSGLVPRRATPILAGGMSIGLLSLTLVTPFRYIAPAYALPTLLGHDDTVPNQVDITFASGDPSSAGGIRLAGYEILEEAVQPGGWLHVTLYWEALQRTDQDLTVALRILGRNGQVVGSKDTFPGLGRYPTSLWQPGRIIKDTYPIQIRFDAEAPARLSFDISLYHRSSMVVLSKLNQAGDEMGQLALGEARLSAPAAATAAIANPAQFTLGEQIEMIGYSADQTALFSPGSSLELTLYWRSLAKPPADYTIFIHLLDGSGQVVAGWDAPPVQGDYPTHLWPAGEVVEDGHTLTLPADLPAGNYRLVAGLYQLDTLQRLPVFDASGRRIADDAIPLMPVAVGEPKT